MIELDSGSRQANDSPAKMRALQLLEEHKQRIYVRTDRLFAVLLVVEWVAAIVLAALISPSSWKVAFSESHIHLMGTLVFGALITAPPILLVIKCPGQAQTRHMIAFCQMLMSALFIHLTGGRIETHFHVFGSLAFLSFYRDWRVLVTASVVVAVDHIVRGYLWPQSVYGITIIDPWRWSEHIGWVIFEDVFLFVTCHQSNVEMKAIASRTAELEHLNSVVTADVTSKSIALKRVERNAQELANIVKHSHEAIYSANLQGIITSWNSGAERLFGFRAEEVMGKPLANIWPAATEEVSFDLEDIEHALRPLEWEASRSTSGGDTVELLLRKSPIFSESGKLVGVSTFASDIAEKKAADRRIGEFYSVVSHELRTPLSSILGALALINEGAIERDSDEAAELLTIAHVSSVRLIRLVNDILDLRKIEAGHIEFQLAPIDCQSVARAAVESMTAFAIQNRITLSCDLVANPTIESDADRLTQVLTNLLSNAIKFSHPGTTVKLKVETLQSKVRFSVIDHGPGIPREQYTKLFSKFGQLDGSDSRPKEGSGLGLAICKAIVEHLNGIIGFDSDMGKGSTFWCEFALEQEPWLVSA